MNCDRCQRDLHDLVDGTLSERRSKALHRHLDSCPQCRELLICDRQLQANLAPALGPALGRVTLGDVARRNILASADAARSRAKTVRFGLTLYRVSLAASLVLAAIGAAGVVYLARHAPEASRGTEPPEHQETARLVALSEKRTPFGMERTMVMQVSNGRKGYGYASATWSGGWIE